MFLQEELKNLDILLQRVNLQGNEALAVAQLQLKIKNLIEKEAPTESKETTQENSPTE